MIVSIFVGILWFLIAMFCVNCNDAFDAYNLKLLLVFLMEKKNFLLNSFIHKN